MKPATEILLSAAFALTPEENWTQNAMAVDDFGYEVVPESRNAVCFCVNGALTAAQLTFGVSRRVFREALAFLRNATGADVVYEWNDTSTHAEVLDALYRAAEISEAS